MNPIKLIQNQTYYWVYINDQGKPISIQNIIFVKLHYKQPSDIGATSWAIPESCEFTLDTRFGNLLLPDSQVMKFVFDTKESAVKCFKEALEKRNKGLISLVCTTRKEIIDNNKMLKEL